MSRVTKILVNGEEVAVDADPAQSLLRVLREQAQLTGPKYGCGEGQCGACTVLLDGTPIRSCITPAAAASDRALTTIEGLEQDGRLHPLQQAFLDVGSFQCGYCTPGMILSAAALLQRHPRPTRQQIVELMDGNVCRCGTYPRILTAISKAAEVMSGGAARGGAR